MCPASRVLILCLALLAGACARYVPTEQWLATWATAPQPAMPGATESFSNQQVRLIVRTTLGGRSVRIRLSNAYGSTPLDIGAARIALRKAGDAIDTKSERVLTFDGKPAATIAPGVTRTSDPIAFDVPANADLAVTLYLPGAVTAQTNHLLALQTSYVSASGAKPDALFVTAREISSWPFLVGVDVVPKDDLAATVVIFGDSTVDGDGSAQDANQRYPDLLANKLSNPATLGMRYSIVNLGIIGNRLLRDSPKGSDFADALGEAGVTRFERDALQVPGVTCVMVRIGTNDIGFPGAFAPADPAVTVAQLAGGFERLAAAAHSRSVRIVATTLAPFEGVDTPGYHTAAKETLRVEINQWIRTSKVFDGLIDADVILRDPANPARLRADYDSGDHLHPNAAGNKAIADAMPIDICTAEPGSGAHR